MNRPAQGPLLFGNQELMYIILEYAIFVGLVLVAGTLLYGACTAFVIIQEAAGLFAGFIGALMRRRVLVVRPTNPLGVSDRLWSDGEHARI